jgi:hypothetical protein
LNYSNFATVATSTFIVVIIDTQHINRPKDSQNYLWQRACCCCGTVVSQRTAGLATEFNATIGKKMRTNSNFMLWITFHVQPANTQLYQYHSKNHHLNALKLPFNSYIE